MAKFFTDKKDYQRYGLDDSRCSVQRPIGYVELSIVEAKWNIITESRKWGFNRNVKWNFSTPLYIRKLYDCFLLHFSYEDVFRPSLMLVVPFAVLSDAETKVVNELSEKRHPKNVDGNFYGKSDECSCIEACSPLEIAPDLIGYDNEPEGCYFIKQPQTEAEYDLAIQAVLSAFVGNLRYSGNNPDILERIRAATRNLELNFCQDDLCDCPTEK
jgi:hypothetical protein